MGHGKTHRSEGRVRAHGGRASMEQIGVARHELDRRREQIGVAWGELDRRSGRHESSSTGGGGENSWSLSLSPTLAVGLYLVKEANKAAQAHPTDQPLSGFSTA